MSQIEKELAELDETDLKKKLCLRCIVSQYAIKNSLYDEKDMKPSPSTSDLICPDCYILEEEKGPKKISKGEWEHAEKIRTTFDEYKKSKGF